MSICPIPGCTRTATELLRITTSETGEALEAQESFWVCQHHTREITSERKFHKLMHQDPLSSVPAAKEVVEIRSEPSAEPLAKASIKPPSDAIPPTTPTASPVEPRKPQKNSRHSNCSVEGCGKKSHIGGQCYTHASARLREMETEIKALRDSRGAPKKGSPALTRLDLMRRFAAFELCRRIQEVPMSWVPDCLQEDVKRVLVPELERIAWKDAR